MKQEVRIRFREPATGNLTKNYSFNHYSNYNNNFLIYQKQMNCLIEQIETNEGHHLFVYPFEGRLVHEAMAAILAYRISRITPITFSFAMNDYGFELLSDQPIPLDDSNAYELFSPENLLKTFNAV